MSVLELFTACEHCPEWEVQVFSPEEKERREQTHAQSKHHTVSAITALLADDPTHEGDKRVIVAAIEVAARANYGLVSANTVRPLLPSYVQPQMVGAVFTSLKAIGRLIPTGDDEPNTDTRSRNTNKTCPVYRMRDAS